MQYHRRLFVAFWILSATLLLTLISCNKDSTSTGILPDDPQYTDKDTLSYLMPDGLEVFLTGLQDTYRLDDSLNIRTFIVNQATTPVDIDFLSYPPFSCANLVDETGRVLSHRCGGGLAMGVQTLMPGDTLFGSYGAWRPHQALLSGDHVPVFSGWYQYREFFTGRTATGSMTDSVLVKWFQVTEEGDPLFFKRRLPLRGANPLQYDFYLRNRISRRLNYIFADPAPISVQISNDSTTVFSISLTTNSAILTLPAKSDSLLFSYILNPNDPALSGLTGQHTMTVTARFKSREISTSTSVSF